MKAIFYISVLVALLVSSCTASRFNQGGEYDDLYYSKSDKQAVNQNVVSKEVVSNPATDKYYDNIYSGDTLIADGYNDAVDFDGSMFYNKDESPFEYADDYSYSNRLSRFYGNYFDPYWRNPYYYGYNNFYDPYMYDPYSYGYGGYGGMYMSFGFNFGYGYGGYYPYYGYGGYYPYYGYGGGYYPGYYPPYYGDESTPAAMGRRQTYSTLSSNYSNITPSRKSGYQTGEGGVSGDQRRTIAGSSQGGLNDARRGSSVLGNSRQGTQSEMRSRESYQVERKGESVNSNSYSSRPEYNSQNRSYTPSYNNPRMSERPSYNNSRVSGGINQSGNSESNRSGSNPGRSYGRAVNEGTGLGRTGNENGNSSGRTISNSSDHGNSMIRYPSSNNYTVPSNSRSEGSSSTYRSSSNYSSGSSSSGSSGYSGGSSSSGGSGGGGGGGYGDRSSGGGSGTRR
jgi:hypothetical protein